MINKKHRKHTSRSSQPYSSQSQEFPEALSNTQVNAKLRKIESLKTSNRFFSPGKQQLEFFKANTKPLEIEITEDKMDMMIKNLEHLKNELKKTGYSEQLSFQYGNENDEKERITSRIDFDSPAERNYSEAENGSEALKEDRREDFRIILNNPNFDLENESTTAKVVPTHSRNLSLDNFVRDVQTKLAKNSEHMKELEIANFRLQKAADEQIEEKNRIINLLAQCNDLDKFRSFKQQLLSEMNEEAVANRKSSGFHFRRNEEYEEANSRFSMTQINEFDFDDRKKVESFSYLKERIKELEECQAKMAKGNQKIQEDLQTELEKAVKERDELKNKEGAYSKEKEDFYLKKLNELKTELEKIVLDKNQLIIENNELAPLKEQVETLKKEIDQSKSDDKIAGKDRDEQTASSKEKEELFFKINELKAELERVCVEKDHLITEKDRLAPFEKEVERLKSERDQSKFEEILKLVVKERDELKTKETTFSKEKEDLYFKISELKTELGGIHLEKDHLLMENNKLKPLIQELEKLKNEKDQPKPKENDKNQQKKKETDLLKEKEQIFKARETELANQIKAKETEFNKIVKEKERLRINETKISAELERIGKERDQLKLKETELAKVTKDKDLSEKDNVRLKQEVSKLNEDLIKLKTSFAKQSSSPPSLNPKKIASSNDMQDSTRLSKSFTDDIEAFKLQNEMQKAELEIQRKKTADWEKKCTDLEKKIELLQNELSESTANLAKNLLETFDRQLVESENTIQNLQEENKIYKQKILTDEQDLIILQKDLHELKIRMENEEKLKEEKINSFEKEVINELSTPKFKKASSQDEIETSPKIKCSKDENEWLNLRILDFDTQVKKFNDSSLETVKIHETYVKDLEALRTANQELESKVECFENKNRDLENAILEKVLEITKLKRELFEVNRDWLKNFKPKTEETQEIINENKETDENENKLDESLVINSDLINNNEENENNDGKLQFSNSQDVRIVEEIEYEDVVSEEQILEKEKKALPSGKANEGFNNEIATLKNELGTKDILISEKESLVINSDLINNNEENENNDGKLQFSIQNSQDVRIVEEIEYEDVVSEEQILEKEKKALPSGKASEGFNNEIATLKNELGTKDILISEKEQLILSLENGKKVFEDIITKLEISVGMKETALEEKEKELLTLKKGMQELRIENQRSEQQMEEKLRNIESNLQENELLKKNNFIQEKDIELHRLEIKNIHDKLSKISLEKDDLQKSIEKIQGELIQLQKDLDEKNKIIDKSKNDIVNVNNLITEKNNSIEKINISMNEEKQMNFTFIEQLKNEKHNLEEDLIKVNKEKQALEKEKQASENNLVEKSNFIEQAQKNIAEKHSEDLKLKENVIEQLKNEKQNLENDFSKSSKEKQTLEISLIEKNNLIEQTQKNNEDLKSKENVIEKLKKDKQDLENDLSQSKKERQVLENGIFEKNKLIEQERTNITEKHGEDLKLKENVIEQLKNDKQNLEKNLSKLSTEKEALEKSIVEKNNIIEQAQKNIAEKNSTDLKLKEKLQNENSTLKQQNEELQKRVGNRNLAKKLSVNQLHEELQLDNKQLMNDLLILESAKTTLEKEKNENNIILNELKESIKVLEKKLADLTNELIEKNNDLAENKKIFEKLENQNKNLIILEKKIIDLEQEKVLMETLLKNEKESAQKNNFDKFKEIKDTLDQEIICLKKEVAEQSKIIEQNKNSDLVLLDAKKQIDLLKDFLNDSKNKQDQLIKKMSEQEANFNKIGKFKEEKEALDQEIINLRNELAEKSKIIEQNKNLEVVLLEAKKQIDLLNILVIESKHNQTQLITKMNEQDANFNKIMEEKKKKDAMNQETEDKLLSYEAKLKEIAKNNEIFENEKKSLSHKIVELTRLNQSKEERIDKMLKNELGLNSKLEQILEKCLALQKENEKLKESETKLKLNFASLKAMLFEENVEKTKLEEQFSQKMKELSINEQKGIKMNSDLKKQVETLQTEVSKKANQLNLLAEDLTESNKFKRNALEDQKKALSIFFDYFNKGLINDMMKKIVNKSNENELKLNKVLYLIESLNRRKLDNERSNDKRKDSPFKNSKSPQKNADENIDWLSLAKSLLLVVSRVINYQKSTFKSYNDLISKIKKYGNPRASSKDLENFKSYCDSMFSQIASQYQEINKYSRNSFKKEDFDIVNNLIIDYSENIKTSQGNIQSLNNNIANNYEEIAKAKFEPFVNQAFKEDDIKPKKEFIEYIAKLAMENKAMKKELNQNYKI